MRKYLVFILNVCFALGLVNQVSAQRFACDGQLLISTTDAAATSIWRPFYIPFNPPFFSPVVKYNGKSFDALGFNSKDNYIYAVEQATNNIIRLKRDNSFEIVGSVSIVNSLNVNAGDCTPEGLYICHDYELNQLLVFDVVDNFELLSRIDLFWSPDSDNNGAFDSRIYDFAIDPNNTSLAYAYQSNHDDESLGPESSRGNILSINVDFDNPDLGMVTPISKLNQNQVSHLGGLLFSPDSGLYGYGTPVSGLNPIQNQFYQINTFNGSVANQFFSWPPDGIFSDGCSCPFSFSFTCSVPDDGMYCNDDLKNFVISIENNSFNPIEGLTLRDTFPEGTMIEEISGVFTGNVSAGMGIGSNILEISDLLIPAKANVVITIKLRSVDAKVGELYNQAFLYDLPETFDNMLASDNPATSHENGDPSLYIIIPRTLENVKWELTSPSECLLANDGKIEVSSPQFFPGQEFEVKIRNKIGWEESTFNTIVDSDNTITLDSLIPGEYQVFQVRSVSDNCSLSARDTIIYLEPPNDLLDLELEGNSPICEGESLLLKSETNAIATIRWTGPSLFGSDIHNPIIDSTIEANSGEYKVVAKYGYCEQIEFIDIDVKGQVNSSITGDTIYCERDKIQLQVEGAGILSRTWVISDSLLSQDSILIVASASDANQGVYTVISSNGACFDTIKQNITVLPAPSIDLPKEIRTDFCESLILIPEVSGGEDLSYNWNPKKGLSCSDCPTPTVLPIVQNSYQLNVENEYQCMDSAIVDIVLDKRNLIYTPNVFTPNNVGDNNFFSVTPGCVVHYIQSLEVLDRWGNLVFQNVANTPEELLKSWDGYINSQVGNTGVYIWFAKVELVDGSIQYLTGDVTLF